MEPDLDDTRLSVPRTSPLAPDVDVDVDDTVARGSVPALVEPPLPVPRALPVVVEPVLVEPVLAELDDAAPPSPAAEFRMVFADGTEIPLDLAAYLGRKPSIPRIHVGPAPRLVTLASPTREMSATHVEIRVVGGALVATDMRSTNGTIVQLPGAPPRTLISGESAVIIAGTRIDLGEGAFFDVLPALEPAENR